MDAAESGWRQPAPPQPGLAPGARLAAALARRRGVGRIPHQRKQVAEFRALGAEVLAVGYARRDLDRNALGHGEPVLLELANLVGVVGDEAHLARTEVEEDPGPDPVVAHVGGEAERVVGLHRVAPL